MTGRLRAAHWPPSYPGPVHPYAGQPPQRPTEAPARLPRDPDLTGLYAGALRHLAARTGLLLGTLALRLAHWGTSETGATALNRAVAAGHPATRPRLTVIPAGIAQGRADAQFTHGNRPPDHSVLACLGLDCPTHRAGHGASEGDPDL